MGQVLVRSDVCFEPFLTKSRPVASNMTRPTFFLRLSHTCLWERRSAIVCVAAKLTFIVHGMPRSFLKDTRYPN